MGRKPVPEELKKIRVSVSLPQHLADKLKAYDNYSSIVEKLLLEYFRNNRNM
ncbi:hypothetical protein D3C81_537180 [compost metagenome]